MHMKTKVTVVVSVYNVERFLPRCLDALVGQTLKNIKIICVDDGSTDNSKKILRDYLKKDKRIILITKKNEGLSSARNAGLKRCDTKYVMFCDGDDFYSPKMCEIMLRAIEESGSDVAACGINVIYEAHSEMRKSDEAYYRLKYSGKNNISDKLMLRTDVSVLDKIFRVDTIKKNQILFPLGLNNEDYYFYNAYMSVSKTAFYVEEKLYNYVRRQGSIMSENFEAENKSMDHLKVAEELFWFYERTNFLIGHKNLFWKQWTMSVWFSVMHSSEKYKNEIIGEARSFARENYDKWRPDMVGVRADVMYIMTDGIVLKGVLKIYSLFSRICRHFSKNGI